MMQDHQPGGWEGVGGSVFPGEEENRTPRMAALESVLGRGCEGAVRAGLAGPVHRRWREGCCAFLGPVTEQAQGPEG